MSVVPRFLKYVESEGDCRLWTGAIGSRGYGLFKVKNHEGKWVSALAHRISYELFVGPIPEGLVIDHICRNRKCVEPRHLRAVTNKQNHEHRDPDRGVCWHKREKGWQASVKHHGRTYHAGVFADREDAVRAVRELRNRLYTHNDLDRTDPTARDALA